jgi:hypothetical protein
MSRTISPTNNHSIPSQLIKLYKTFNIRYYHNYANTNNSNNLINHKTNNNNNNNNNNNSNKSSNSIHTNAKYTSNSSALHLFPSRSFVSLISERISEYSRLPQKGITLQQLLSVGPKPTQASLIESANFLHKELPIRLAKKVKELESLPYGLSQTAPVQRVRDW